MSLHPNLSLHLSHSPFEAVVVTLSDACVINIGQPGAVLANLTLFFALDKLEQVQRVADALNEIGKPSAASNPLAA